MSETIQPSEENKDKKEIIVQEQLPNATAVLVLGILSILFWCCFGLGLIMGIIALILGSKSKNLYKEAPERYSASSYKNLNAGWICALIGVILTGIWLVIGIIGILIGTGFMHYFPWEDILKGM